MEHAKSGDKVKIHFTGKTQDGDVFATSHGQEPLEFKIGEGSLLPGIEKAVEGMEQGQQKTVTINPSEGYGERHDELILEVDRSQFPKDFNPEVGMHLQVPQPDGSFVVFQILDINNTTVKLDANHPLAGKVLTFDLELLEISANV